MHLGFRRWRCLCRKRSVWDRCMLGNWRDLSRPGKTRGQTVTCTPTQPVAREEMAELKIGMLAYFGYLPFAPF